MSTPPTGARAAAKRATREALVAAAVAELFERGLSGSSLDAICARAGYTRGAFYVHFADREALMVAAMDQVLGELVRSVAAAGQASTGGLAGGIRHFAASAAARTPAVHSGRGLRFHQLLEACHSSRVIGDRYRAILAAASAWARHGVTEQHGRGRLTDVDAGAAAQVLVAASLGLIAMFELGLPVDAARMGETLIKLCQLEAPALRRRGSRRVRRTG